MSDFTDAEWAEIERQAKVEQQCSDEMAADVKAHNDAFQKQWPDYCRNCGGWGMFFYPGKYSGPPERCYPDDQEPCEALADDQCHRCSAHAVDLKTIDQYEELVCRACGWICGQDGLRSI